MNHDRTPVPPQNAPIPVLPMNPTEEDIIKFMAEVNIKSRYDRKEEWQTDIVSQATLYVPDFLEGKGDSDLIPEPPQGSTYVFPSWAYVHFKFSSGGSYNLNEVKFFCALWAYTGEKGCPLVSGWTSDLSWEYVPAEVIPPMDKITIGQVEYTQETLAVYGYITWALSLRFAERNPDTDLSQHAVFTSVQRFFPVIQNTNLLVKMVEYTSSRLRGFFRSGAPCCASLSCVLYCPTILKDHTGGKKQYQQDSNRNIPNIETGWFGLMSIGVFMSGFSSYETMVEGLRKHRKCLQDIIPYFPFHPFIEYFNAAAETNVKLADDPWYGLCQKLYENADTPMSANKFPVPAYVGICFQVITEKGIVPPSMPGVEILDTVRERYAAYVYFIIDSWEKPPVLSGTRQIVEVKDKVIVGRREFRVTEQDLVDYTQRLHFNLPDIASQTRQPNDVPRSSGAHLPELSDNTESSGGVEDDIEAI